MEFEESRILGVKRSLRLFELAHYGLSLKATLRNCITLYLFMRLFGSVATESRQTSWGEYRISCGWGSPD